MALPDVPCTILQAGFTVDERAAFLKELADIADRTGSRIVCFRAGSLAGRAHVKAALARAARSFAEGNPIARTLEMEALLYASGSRQCSGTDAFSIHPGPNRAYVCICPESAEAKQLLGAFMRWNEDDWEEISPEKEARLRELFGITQAELDAAGGPDRLPDLVLERVALLEVYR